MPDTVLGTDWNEVRPLPLGASSLSGEAGEQVLGFCTLGTRAQPDLR